MVQNQGKKCFAFFQQYRKFTNLNQYSRYQNQCIVVFSTNGFKNNNPFVLDKSLYTSYRKLLPKVPKDDSDLTFYYNIGEWGFQDCPVFWPGDYKGPAEWGEYKECINGSFAKGINMGVHDDWGGPNVKYGEYNMANGLNICQVLPAYQPTHICDHYAANIMNIKVHCTEYMNGETGSTIFEGAFPFPLDANEKKLYVF